MKKVKRILSLILSLIMVMSMGIAVKAEEDDYVITITNADAISSKGHVYEAYQIFSGKLDSSGTILTEIEWGAHVNGEDLLAMLKRNPADPDPNKRLDPAFVVDGVNLFASAATAEDVAKILEDPANHTSDFLGAFAKVAMANKITPASFVSTEDDQPYKIQIPKNMAGYYLVVDKIEAILDGEDNPIPNRDVSDFILQVVGDVTVEHKGSIPTMDKQVSETGSTYHDSISTGINEVHYYRIVAELPDDYRLYDEYYLEFVDNFSVGLSFKDIVAVKALIRSSGNEIVIDDTCYSSTYVDDKHVLTVELPNLKEAKAEGTSDKISLTADDAIEIIYTAKLNKNAIVDGNGIPNTAHIVYSNNPNSDGTGKSSPDETNVYPINLNVLKIDGKDKKTPLGDAEFVLARPYSDGVDKHNEYAVVVEGKISEWVHHYEDDGCDDSTHSGVKLGTVLVTSNTEDNKGKISVSGLKAGLYSLIEIKAPDGYNKLAEAVDFAVSVVIDEEHDTISSMTGNTNQGALTFTPENATVQLTIDNFKGNVLPSTGGIGTTMFYIVGGILFVGAIVLLVSKKRMGSKE